MTIALSARMAAGSSIPIDGSCFHCGDRLPARPDWQACIDGVWQRMCCAGCQAVAETIAAHGLTAYYRERSSPATEPAPLTPAIRAMLAGLDEPEVTQAYAHEFSSREGESLRSAVVSLGGMSCAACAWLLERRMAQLPGVSGCEVNFASRQATLTWQPQETRFASLVAAIRELGFDAAPLSLGTRQAQLDAEFRTELRRFGVSALFGMQVMMVAAGLYFEGDGDLEGFRGPLNLLCALFTLPVVSWCAWPFYRGAWFAVKARGVTMDVPITLGVVLAFVGSMLSLWRGAGEVYFDSVTMFVSLLLLSRLVERMAWRRSVSYLDALARVEPALVERATEEEGHAVFEAVPVNRVRPGDHLRIATGATLPCDGVILQGSSSLDEHLLTGESTPRRKGAGDQVVSGSTNVESPLVIEVTATGEDTLLARIGTLAREAMARKPDSLTQAQAAASAFIWIVLGLALFTALFHAFWRHEPWLAPTLVVLVISCPCALALAAPAAMSMALASLLARGVLVLHPDSLSRLAEVRRVVFDKTGTLTTGNLQLVDVQIFDPACSRSRVLALAKALESGSTHPIARVFEKLVCKGETPVLQDVKHRTGYGASAFLAGRSLHLGSRRHLEAQGVSVAELPRASADFKEAWLAQDSRVIACFRLRDEMRPEAPALLSYLRAQGIVPAIMSGDHAPAVHELAHTLGIDEAFASCDPGDKLRHLEDMMQSAMPVAVVGDGINDTPIIARADVGITLGMASAHAKLNADIVLLSQGLGTLAHLHRTARRLSAITRQNLHWALAYNVIALPLALAGVFAPWVAALLMAASSVAVVANASRLYEGPR